MNDKDIITRDPKTISVMLSDIERQIYDGVINQYDDQKNLGLIQRKRQMASCIVAFQTSRTALEREYMKGIFLTLSTKRLKQ